VPGYFFVQHLGTTSSGSRSAVRYERVHVTSIAEQLSHLSEFSVVSQFEFAQPCNPVRGD
jgi:hypothetical protein